ncbi:unnamed protein product [Closterium sp. NIES-54]
MRKKYEAKAAAAAQRRQATSDAIASVTSSGKRSRITDYLETGAEAGKRDAHEALALMFAGCFSAMVEEDEEQLSYSNKVHIRRLLKNRWDGSLACPMHVAGRILNPANQDEDIFGSDAECTKLFKAFITQHAKHLCNLGKEGDDGDDFGEVLLELQEGVRAFLDMKGSFGMGDAIAQRSLVKEGKYDMVKWWQWHGTDAPKLAALAIRTLSQAVSASPCERGWSTWDGVHTARRNRLGSAKCRDLVFVAHNWNVVRNWHSRADVMPGVVLGNMPEPPMPEGYNVVEGDEEEEEEEGDDVILEDEYE